jgi:hypothetical protein
MKFSINKDSNIIKYNLSEIIKAVKKDTYENPQFDFDSNYTMIMFFNYFIDLAESGNKKEDVKLLKDFIQTQLDALPSTYEGVLEKCLDLLEYDEDLEKMFKSSSVEVITSFFYHPFSSFIYDELFLFYDKSPVIKVLKDKFKTDNFSQLTYELNLDLSKDIKNKIGHSKYENILTDEEIALYEKNKLSEKKIKDLLPKDINEAVDVLVEMFEDNENHKVDITSEETTEVYTSMLFFHLYDYMFFSFKLYSEEAPLVKYFKEKKNIDDPYQMIYEIIKTFVIYVKLKKSI